MPTVYNGLQSSFVSLAWPWSGRSLPQGEPVGVLGAWTGAQCDQTPCPPATNYLTNQKPDMLIFYHMAGWLANCSWQAGWIPIKENVKPDPPLGRDILWPSVWLLWSHRPVVRCNPLMRLQVRLTFGQTSGQVNIRSDVPSKTDFSEMLQKYFLKYTDWSNCQKNSNKSMYKQLRAI